MLKNIRLLALVVIALCVSCASHATLFKLDYSGKLTDRYTTGYEFDEYISGTLMFDLAFAADEYPQDEFYSEYRILPGALDFVTGYVTPNVGINDDFVRVSNGYGEPAHPEPFWDGFNFYDSSIVEGGIKDALFIGVEVENLDWLFNDSVKGFSYTGSDMNERSTAVISRSIYTNEGGGTVRRIYDAYYLLDFAELRAVNVPEPGSLYLLLIGGLALLLRRGNKNS